MNLEALLSSLLDNLPETVQLDFPIPELSEYLPTQMDFASMVKFLAVLAAGSLILGVAGRVIGGKRSEMNHAVSSAIGILFVYGLTVLIYSFRPWNLEKLLSPLPFVAFAGEYLSLFPLQCGNISAICYEVVSLLILAFLTNLLDTFVPEGKSIPGWFVLRFLTVLLAMVIHIAVRWAINMYLPDILVTYAPMILLGVLAAMLLLGVFNVIASVLLAAVEPILGAIYGFFFSNIVGKQLTKAVLTTVILVGLVYLLEHFGIFLICVSQAALIACVPMLIIAMVLWYVIGHIL